MNRPIRCARCRRRLRNCHWIFSSHTRLHYCWPGEGCQKKKARDRG